MKSFKNSSQAYITQHTNTYLASSFYYNFTENINKHAIQVMNQLIQATTTVITISYFYMHPHFSKTIPL